MFIKSTSSPIEQYGSGSQEVTAVTMNLRYKNYLPPITCTIIVVNMNVTYLNAVPLHIFASLLLLVVVLCCCCCCINFVHFKFLFFSLLREQQQEFSLQPLPQPILRHNKQTQNLRCITSYFYFEFFTLIVIVVVVVVN